MLLKGLYNTKIDRMTTENYNRYMCLTFGVFIVEGRCSQYKGFIKQNAWFDVYIPILIDGNISSFKYEDMRHITTQDGIVNTKRYIKEDIKRRPEYYIQLAEAMKKLRERR